MAINIKSKILGLLDNITFVALIYSVVSLYFVIEEVLVFDKRSITISHIIDITLRVLVDAMPKTIAMVIIIIVIGYAFRHKSKTKK